MPPACTWYTWLFLAAFAAHRGLELALDLVQIRHLLRRGDRVPAHLAGEVDPETVRRAIRYNLARLRFGALAKLFDAAVVAALIGFGLAALDAAAGALFGPGIPRGLAFFALFWLATALLRLPLDLYATFSIEARHGFNRQSPAGFAADRLKGAAVGIALGAPLLALVLWLLAALPQRFWLVGFACVAAFQLFVAWIYPVAVMPLFNRFTPVAADLAADVAGLARRVGFPLAGVVAMDGSRRSAHANAFIVGLVGARRIVLFDTLIEKLARPELIAVVAHELGHFRLGHVRRRLLGALAALAALFAAFGAVGGDPALARGLGFAAASDHAALAAFFLLAAEAAFPLLWLGRVASRRQERAADAFAVAATGGEALAGALVALNKQNLASPGSAKAYRAYHNTHPSLRERLKAIRAAGGEKE